MMKDRGFLNVRKMKIDTLPVYIVELFSCVSGSFLLCGRAAYFAIKWTQSPAYKPGRQIWHAEGPLELSEMVEDYRGAELREHLADFKHNL